MQQKGKIEIAEIDPGLRLFRSKLQYTELKTREELSKIKNCNSCARPMTIPITGRCHMVDEGKLDDQKLVRKQNG